MGEASRMAALLKQTLPFLRLAALDANNDRPLSGLIADIEVALNVAEPGGRGMSECPDCENYVGKCPTCHRPRPSPMGEASRDAVERLRVALERTREHLDRFVNPYGQDDPWAGANEALENADEVLRQTIAALSSAEPGGWRPIETAPKDGTEVLGFDGRVLFSMRWVSRHRLPSTWHDRSANRWANPTHWMPLPSAPNPPSPENVG